MRLNEILRNNQRWRLLSEASQKHKHTHDPFPHVSLQSPTQDILWLASPSCSGSIPLTCQLKSHKIVSFSEGMFTRKFPRSTENQIPDSTLYWEGGRVGDHPFAQLIPNVNGDFISCWEQLSFFAVLVTGQHESRSCWKIKLAHTYAGIFFIYELGWQQLRVLRAKIFSFFHLLILSILHLSLC